MKKKKEFDKEKHKHKEEFAEDAKLTLHEERMDIDKDRVKSGEVNLHKDVIEEYKAVDVPVSREEVIIERRALNEQSDTPIGEEETYHIQTNRDEIDVDKHTMVTGQVEAHKQSVEGSRQVDKKLKREEADIDAEGEPRLKKKDKYRH
ncbi:YsnF/AvaK domain-containing protein [Dethiobacter alkaliphilus]|uniref:DUF2382 domain-containing protein n=1 Tax=Dethiobacter alkaliphilus AHT 1 TaxID=555088 RepID=C0GDD1_DETAL|nr:YsnF/AvaK domain-containing protein [Dethiobacter alkaliphilus]EEG78652.1 conserved hypothetical protein [Dethiobacter alkaliphilus AHT 1]